MIITDRGDSKKHWDNDDDDEDGDDYIQLQGSGNHISIYVL